uniref:Uncharacterized protein LOC113799822 n=1 Tax=Dermatophagoides pteronyssinus TaxID=6956 RepID=A0A6P6YMP1_DERPT|nr:uncharacterized protein LOC113799822 [Dermatophagoides pteronyssinus]
MFEQLLKDIDENSKQLTRFISVIISTTTMDSAYLVFLLFMTKHPIMYQILYFSTTLAIIGTLASLILGCSIICSTNRKLLKLKQKSLLLFIMHGNSGKIFTTSQMLKFDSITNTLLNQSLGFRLTNGITITSYTFITIIFNISTFFFLISPHIY